MAATAEAGPAPAGERADAAGDQTRFWMFVALCIAPAIMIVGKLHGSPAEEFLNRWFSLADLPERMKAHVEYVLFVPLSAVVVSFFRLTLGLPVLSLFRPILVAIAFRIMGIPMGLAFLALVLGVVIAIRPLIKSAHYYARVPILLSLVAAFMILPLIACKLWPEDWLRHLAYFPIISLSLICEAFTKKLDEGGFAEAAWPTTNTILIGVIITLLARIPGAFHLLLRFPELLLAQAGIVLLISESMHFELLGGKNPFLAGRKTVQTQSVPWPSGTAPMLLEPERREVSIQ
jgi:7 transmembrane helices usually fused to an inactive transglutaminase